MKNGYISKIEELSLRIFIEEDELRKLQHRDSVFTINFVNEHHEDIITFDQALERTRNSIIKKINQLQLEYYELRTKRL